MKYQKGHIPWNKGKTHTKETKEKLKKALFERRQKGEIFGFQKGHKGFWTKERRKKRSEIRKGYKHKKEIIKKMKQTWKDKSRPWLKGKKNPAWKGGITSKNKLIRHSIEFNILRKSIFERDNWTCQSCGKRGGIYLHAHHILSFAKFPQLRFAINNGITLCKKCHKKIHERT